MATPHVAGAVLQLLQHYPHYKPADIQHALDCMATKGVLQGLQQGQTPDRLLHSGQWIEGPVATQALGQIAKRSVAANGAVKGESVDSAAVDDLLNSDKCHANDGTEAMGVVPAHHAHHQARSQRALQP